MTDPTERPLSESATYSQDKADIATAIAKIPNDLSNATDPTHPKTNGHKLTAHRYSINFEQL